MRIENKSRFLLRMLMLVLFFIGVLLLLWVFDGCPIRRFTGIPCPGCGLTRAWLAVFCWEWQAAFAYHPMFWAVPMLCIFIVFDGRLFRKKWLNYGFLLVLALGFSINYIYQLVTYFSGISAV